MKVEFLRGNIVEAEVDAIVNAANTDLILGSGVAGAIRKAGGPRIQEECNRLAPIAVGKVAVTGAGNLPHRYVLHAATMTLQQPQTSMDIVASCTREALNHACKLGCHGLAFPALGTGVAGLSVQDCAKAMLETVNEFLRQKHRQCLLERIIFVLFDEQAEIVFRTTWQKLQYERPH